jgi:hypothetical protein
VLRKVTARPARHLPGQDITALRTGFFNRDGLSIPGVGRGIAFGRC